MNSNDAVCCSHKCRAITVISLHIFSYMVVGICLTYIILSGENTTDSKTNNIIFIISYTLLTIWIIINILAIVGIVKHKSGFIIPWLVANAFGVVVSTISTFITIITDISIMPGAVLIRCLILGLAYLMFYIVNSYYSWIKENPNVNHSALAEESLYE